LSHGCWGARCTVFFPAGRELETRFTARFAARCTAATAPRTELVMDLTASFAVFLTCFSMGPCAASFSAFDVWCMSACVRALVGLDVLELAALVTDGAADRGEGRELVAQRR
jgi:hypothetical protein